MIVRAWTCPPRRGAVLVWLLLAMTVILGVVALGMDGGRLMEERRHVQVTADAAALAAAANLYQGYWQNQGKDPNGTARAAALTSASANGIVNDGVNQTVTVNIPPTSGTYAGQAGYVEVIVQSTIAPGFGSIFANHNLPVRGRAVALGQPARIGLILLRPTGADAFLNNAVAFTLVNGDVIVNSNDPAAYDQKAFGAVVANRIDVTGNYINPGDAVILARVRTGIRPSPDPLAGLQVPDQTTALVQSTKPLAINSLLPTILQPGVYRGGIQVSGLSVVTLQPGVYIMDGGGFTVGGTATVAGIGVTIYNTAGTYAAGPIQVGGLGKVILTAPWSGTYQGINFFQDRSLTQPLTITGVGLTAITGVVYAARGPVHLSSSAAIGVDILGGAYVCDSMSVTGLGSINVDLKLNPPRVPEVHLAE